MRNFVSKFFCRKKTRTDTVSELAVLKFSSHGDYLNYAISDRKISENRVLYEKSLIPDGAQEFIFSGYCFACKKDVDFLVDFHSSYMVDDVLMPNWRERLVCPVCHLNNRMRAALHIFDKECQPDVSSNIYITEQVTPLFSWLQALFPRIAGSEYCGDSVTASLFDSGNIRNENITKLSFKDNEFDFILSFDVLEHVFEYRTALKEFFRCLKPGGTLFFSVPFVLQSEKNIVRAAVTADGKINHCMSPEYHGDPLNSKGCLCFYHFGWELLDDLKLAGFETANVMIYWSKRFGYLGKEQSLFSAKKPG